VKKLFFIVLVAFAACSTPTPPQPESAPAQPQAPAEEAIGTVKITATMLNVRREASSSSDVITQVRKGERLPLLASPSDDWFRIRLGTGEVGFVSAAYAIREGVPTRTRRGCAADADYAFVKTPVPAFSDSSAHGIVTVDANVDVHGNVTSTKVIDNTTGDPALATLAEREIRSATFTPPVRNCVPKAFIFTYKRSF
jgi:uncharacterized protein YgiM (DUF1202 family)